MSETESTIRVVIRTRPTQHFAQKNININTLENRISVTIPRNEARGLVNNQKENWQFQFDKILHNVPQEEVFEWCVSDIIKTSVKGLNGTVFAYGQTGSGKTFTISGSPSNYNYRGIIPRAITRLFQELGGHPEFDTKVSLSYLEIYNETVFDLLAPTQTEKNDITFQEDTKGNVIIKGLTQQVVNNEEEAFNVVFEGESNRTIAVHELNKESTRSHCVFTINLEMKSKVDSSEKVLTSKLNFVDLAGSERVNKTGSTGITLKEATYINKSLTFLEQVVVALTDKTKRKEYVPYRQSKLTHILKDSIGGNCKTTMIATIWPEENFILETLSTLNFAKRMKNVVNELSVNIRLDTDALLKKLTKEIKDLKQELLMHNTLSNRGKINYDPYTPEEQYEQQLTAQKFLSGELEDMDFDSVRQAKELFNQCRIIFQKTYSDNDFGNEKTKEAIEKKKTVFVEEVPQSIKSEDQIGVGTFIEKPSFGIGRAPKDARPIVKIENTGNMNQTMRSMMESTNTIGNENVVVKEGEENKNESANIAIKDNNQDADVVYKNQEDEEYEDIDPSNIPDKNSAFVLYKAENEGAKDIEQNIIQTTTDLRVKKEEAKKLAEEGNKLKEKIEELKNALKEKQQNKMNLADEMTNVIDDEECKLIDELKEVKTNYKETVDNFKHSKVEINEMRNNLDLLKIKYVDNFENWFLKKYHIRLEEHELRLAKAKYGVQVQDNIENEKINDPEEEAYNNAKKKIQTIHKAKKAEKRLPS